MKKNIRKVSIILLIILCIGVVWGCGNGLQAQLLTESENILSKNEQENNESEDDELEDNDSEDVNKKLFYEKSDKQGIDRESAEKYFQTLLDDDVFQNGAMELTGLIIDDMDGNGQKDMLVTVLDSEQKPFYGSGCLWIYMNEDEPYCFAEEDCSYYGWFNAFHADIDNDENMEIVFSAQGSGCGAVGDSYKAIFKYKDHNIVRMELPSDLNEDYDQGLNVIVSQKPEENSYGAYCPYFDEIISFQAFNSFDPTDTTQIVGHNVRGFFDLQCVEYEGQNALQASEYLNGEGGTVHCVATAQFLIVWDENGEASVAKWWIVMDENIVDNSHDSRIVYTDEVATAKLCG
ncbi:MAG: hypothetical protein K2K21_17155 [Lachnospiraceae bacterium]|nr:hypothetical protein [Lachnospiraceae bacterium]